MVNRFYDEDVGRVAVLFWWGHPDSRYEKDSYHEKIVMRTLTLMLVSLG
jgi:trehalose utilization protein